MQTEVHQDCPVFDQNAKTEEEKHKETCIQRLKGMIKLSLQRFVNYNNHLTHQHVDIQITFLTLQFLIVNQEALSLNINNKIITYFQPSTFHDFLLTPAVDGYVLR